MVIGRFLKEKYIHRVFEFGVVIKGINGLIETVGGAVLLFVSRAKLGALFYFLTQRELAEDPHDGLVNYLGHYFQSMTAYSKYFGAIYLITHGVIKIFLVAGLLRNRLWAYPASMGFFILFILYQLYHLSHTYSLGLVLLTILDALVVVLTWHEYRYILRHKRFPV